jgi:hypothetical protein
MALVEAQAPHTQPNEILWPTKPAPRDGQYEEQITDDPRDIRNEPLNQPQLPSEDR